MIESRWLRLRSAVAALGALAALAALAGCSDSVGPSAGLSTDPYTSLRLNIQSAVMSTVAPYNTLQLVATPYTASGKVYDDSTVVSFSVADTSLTVSASGLVTAQSVTPGTFVVATLRDATHNVTRTDTLFVAITDETPASPLAAFAIHRPAGDSAKIGVYDYAILLYQDTVLVAGTAQDGSDLTPVLPIRFTSSDSTRAVVDPYFGVVTGMKPGPVTIRVTTTYYGVTMTDSLKMMIGNPVSARVQSTLKPSPTVGGQYVLAFVPDTIEIGVGGTISFAQGAILDGPELGMDVIFDDPSAAQPSPIPPERTFLGTGSGNIGPLPPLVHDGQINLDCLVIGASCLGETRAFPQAGVYRYHSAQFGTKGVIVVKGP